MNLEIKQENDKIKLKERKTLKLELIFSLRGLKLYFLLNETLVIFHKLIDFSL